ELVSHPSQKKKAAVDLGQTEHRLVGGKGDVATGNDGKRSTEAPTVHHRDGRHGKRTENSDAPFERFIQQGFKFHAIPLFKEKFLQVFSRREAISLPSNDQNAKVLVIP